MFENCRCNIAVYLLLTNKVMSNNNSFNRVCVCVCVCRFGDGYTVIVRVRGGLTDLSAVEEFVRGTFPGSVLKEKHHNTLQYQMPRTEGALSHIFTEFSEHQEILGVEDYSVSQTTLDQVTKHCYHYTRVKIV